jgi:hypothetical protein
MRVFKTILCACLASFVLAGYSQQPALAQISSKLPAKTPLEAGTVEGNTYKNDSLKLEITPAPNLKFSTPEMEGKPGSVPLLVTVAAWSGDDASSSNAGTVFYADDLAYYPETERSAEAYLRKVARANFNFGFEPVESEEKDHLGGLLFSRSDFRKNVAYQAVLVKICNGYAFVFIFAGAGLDRVNDLIAQTKVRLTLQEETSESNPIVTVTPKIQSQNHDPYTYSYAHSLLNSSTSFQGRDYHNDFFGFSYRLLPSGWKAEDTEITVRKNKGATVRSEPPGSPLTSATVRILGPVILLSATPADAANREQLAPPFLTITVDPSGGSPLSVESMKRDLKSGELTRESHGIHLLADPTEITIGGRVFFRTDFSETKDNVTSWKAFLRTDIHGGQLVVNFCARSKAELDQLLATINSIAFDEPRTNSPESDPSKP